jgi:hypothetical protein
MVDSCESKMPCITMVDENLQLLCNEDMVTLWKDFEKNRCIKLKLFLQFSDYNTKQINVSMANII